MKILEDESEHLNLRSKHPTACLNIILEDENEDLNLRSKHPTASAGNFRVNVSDQDFVPKFAEGHCHRAYNRGQTRDI